ncbi:MAG: glycosyltransferase [Eubacteriales bacterium]|nr:glycosyltransferase [Eubacteriales bacterium]
MISISLCMIVRDEAAVLARCLDSVGNAVDEMIIVDTGSVDRTRQIAKAYTDKVYDFPWQDDFASARNFSLDRGTKDFLLWMDADDVLPRDSKEKLIEWKQSPSSNATLVMMPYQVAFDESGTCTFSYWRERLIRRSSGLRFQGRVHEAIVPRGTIVHKDIPVKHCKIKTGSSDRNLRIYEKMEREGEIFEPRAQYYYGRELLQHGQWEKACHILEKFLAHPDGWVENKIDGARQLAEARRQLGDWEGELQALLQTLEYDVPRGETCCCLGRYFFERSSYDQASYWYRQALQSKRASYQGAFIEEACYGYLPAIMLCVCCDRMGKRKEAEQWNDLAGYYRPNSEAYQQNRAYFQKRQVQEER